MSMIVKNNIFSHFLQLRAFRFYNNVKKGPARLHIADRWLNFAVINSVNGS